MTTLDEGAPSAKVQTLRLAGAGVSLIAVCYGLARFAYGLFVPAFRDEFALTATVIGVIAAGSYVSYCVAIAVTTVLIPRWGSRPLVAVAGGLATVGTALVAVAPHGVMLAVGVIVAGASTGVASPPLAHAVAHAVPAKDRDRIQAVVNAGTGAGVAVAGPVALLVRDQWRIGWLAFAVMCAVATIWAAVVVRTPAPREPMPREMLPRPLLPSGGAHLLVAAATMGLSSSAIWTFGREMLVTEGGQSERFSLVAWILLGACGLAGAAAGDAIGRLGLRRAWQFVAVLLAATTGLLAAWPEIAGAWAMLAVFGAAYIALTGIVLIWGSRIYGRTPAAGVGLSFLVFALGQALGAPLIGLVAQLAGLPTAFGVAAAVAVIGAVLAPRRSLEGG
ncbi:MFS transporter [Aeromicrobium sp. YIM 150415]|uniref:MFS transporter n=1 Tax=Aeromicrobium sp. YIM 150415 TaxID=2803912 RepID=UPI00196693CE|nr:MFS transporter [Aeromicrobium sp. YIM 150415]MBM9461840.1 MFS transporter [Aeromicrobium sp. YIM 150415]MBM9463188.1 MFS transporter [Aeromicrobium sp. YIM 150415]